MTILPITNLVLGSGGMSGMSYLGVLRYFQEQGYMKHVKHCYGVSIGAFFGFLFASKIKIGDIEAVLKEAYCCSENTFCAFHQLTSIQSRFGMDSGERLILPLKKIYQSYYSSLFPSKSYTIDNLTFIDFTKHTGCTLTVVATNVSLKQPTFFSIETTPTLSIWTAIQASMSIPGLFEPVKIKEDYYVDGYLTCEYPSPKLLDKSSTLGIFISTESLSLLKSNLPIQGCVQYMTQLIELVLFYPKETNRIKECLDHFILLDKNPIEFLPIALHPEGIYFNILESDIDLSMGYGYEKTYTFFTQLLSNQKDILQKDL